MNVIKCVIRGQALTVLTPLMADLTVNYFNVEADFSREWDNGPYGVLTKHVHIHKKDDHNVGSDWALDSDNKLASTNGINLSAGTWEIWFSSAILDGSTSETVWRLTTEVKTFEVLETGTGGGYMPDIPESNVDQITAIAQNALDVAQSVRDDADAGEFDGPPGPQGEPGNYTKPATGIPISDLSQNVQDDLDNIKLRVKIEEYAIVINGNRPLTNANSGQYVIIRNSTITGIDDGLYRLRNAIRTDTDVTSADLLDITSGGLNTINSDIATRPLRNMLDNWYFPNPVNQRGQSSYSNADAYTIDRWKLKSGSVSVVPGVGIRLNGTLVQILENAIGQSVVCSALLSDGTMITPTYNDNTKTFTLTATGKTIVAVKLEIGSESTLAHQENGLFVLNEIPDYWEELEKCKYFFERLSGAFTTFGNGYELNSNTAIIFGKCASKRTVVGINNNTSINGTIYIADSDHLGSEAIACTLFSNLACTKNGGFQVTLKNMSNLTKDKPCFAQFRDASSYFDISADL